MIGTLEIVKKFYEFCFEILILIGSYFTHTQTFLPNCL